MPVWCTWERDFLFATRRLKDEEAMTPVEPPGRGAIAASRVLDYIRQLRCGLGQGIAADAGHHVQAVYQSVTVRGDEFVSVPLTDDAYTHGMAVALPQEVRVAAPPGPGRPGNLSPPEGRFVPRPHANRTSDRRRAAYRSAASRSPIPTGAPEIYLLA